MLFNFFPDAHQASELEKKMRLSLADSLIYISEASKSKLEFNFDLLFPIIKSIQEGTSFSSITSYIYSELVLAILRKDNQQAIDLLNQLCLLIPAASNITDPCRILSFSDSAHLPHQKIYLRAMNNDPTIFFNMEAPTDALAAEFEQRIKSGFKLMVKAIPDLADEFKVLVKDIVMVIGDDKAEYQFDGGSSYFLRGTLFLNANSHQNDILMIEVLAHESAHMLLYACASDEALVENSDNERYASPLRIDLRPMDGIYHATFVSARMHWAMEQLINSELLNQEDLQIALHARGQDYRNFWSGYEVIKEHGKLTKTGAIILESAAHYMRQSAGHFL